MCENVLVWANSFRQKGVCAILCMYKKCSVLVRLGFAPSEIGILTGRKLSDIANIRKRLLLKLSNREGSAKDFDIYMKEEF